MSGRFPLALFFLSVAGLAASSVLAFVLIRRWEQFPWAWHFGLFLIPLVLTMIAMHPRDEGERLLSGAGTGLHPSNRRRALLSCFAPYRPMSLDKWIARRPRIMLVQILLIPLVLISGLILPMAFFLAAILTLRRAAWAGSALAVRLEGGLFGKKGPVRRKPCRAERARLKRRQLLSIQRASL